MDKQILIENAKKILAIQSLTERLFQATEFLRIYAGERSSFFRQLNILSIRSFEKDISHATIGSLKGFISFLENGLTEGISIERKAQIDVVSDYLDQAQSLLANNSFHPAAACVIIGASLEEFLRNWVEEINLVLDGKPSIDLYAKALREKELITRQDMKDITSWGGLRNHAAHGEWDEVSDRKRINVMLESVNLFMSRYGR